MKTRFLAALTVGVFSILIISVILSFFEGWVFLASGTAFAILIHIFFVIDERVKPYTTLIDWISGRFPKPSEMSEDGVERRLNILKYKSEDGPLKIRLLFNRRHSSEEIENAKQKLKDRIEEFE